MRALAGSFLLLTLSAAYAQAPSALTILDAAELEWKAPGSLPPGAEFHAVFENKETHAVQLLVRFPSGYELPAHSHTHDEVIVVVKGKLEIEAQGAKKTVGEGGYAFLPAGVPHVLRVRSWGKCLFTVSISGAFDISGLPAVK